MRSVKITFPHSGKGQHIIMDKDTPAHSKSFRMRARQKKKKNTYQATQAKQQHSLNEMFTFTMPGERQCCKKKTGEKREDYGLQIMKTQNSVSQKIWILHKINKKGYFKHKYQVSEKYVHFYAINTWLGLLLHELLHQCGVAWDNQPVALLRCNGSPGCFAFRSSPLLGLVSLIFLLTIPHIFSIGFRSGEFAGQ